MNKFLLYFLYCFADFFELISKAQANRMDDQRGELKGNLELPEFLKIPNNKPAQTDDDFNVPYAPPPPPGFRNGVETNFKKPMVKKTMSTPLSQMPDKMDLMQELSAKLSKRSDATKNNSSSSREKVDRNPEQTEMLLDYNFNSHSQPQPERSSKRAGVISAEGRDVRPTRPRALTDAVVYTVDASHGMRVETGHRPQPVAEAEPRRNVAHVHPSVRPQTSQPVTVNSLRGIHYATNPRRSTGDQATYSRPSNVANVKPQTIARISSKSPQNLRETAPAIYDVKPGSIREAMRIKVSDDSVKFSSAPVGIPSRKIVSAYSLPEVNSKKAEILVPSKGGPPPVPRRTVSNMDFRRPRPKPITDPKELLAGLENRPVQSRLNTSSPDSVGSPPNGDVARVVSPLPPPPPTPPSGSFHDLQIADFSPPPSICESPGKRPHPPEHRFSLDFSRFPQTSASQSGPFPISTTSQVRNSSNSLPNYAGPVAYVNAPSGDAQRQRIDSNRSTNYNNQSVTMHTRVSNSHTPNLTNSTQRGRGEDRMDASSQPVRPAEIHTPGSVTPSVLNGNKTITPPSTNERTLIEESPQENATPYAGNRPSMGTAAKRLIQNVGSVPKRTTDPEKRRSRQDGEIPKLDPYVTYENEDLRVTFV